ncbi:hypothetical protein DH2020_000190 [Rehmannia glutinosa]|uniref:RNase H type-1 domain-containing protein n=1 Tax=Rehmannia glutinosa TaxID=99300 RepID=A0ABR0XVT2_REHGL
MNCWANNVHIVLRNGYKARSDLSEEVEVDIAEALACKEGLLLAQNMGLRKIVLETDSATVHSKLKSDKADFLYLGRIVEDIKLISLSFDSFIPSFIRSSGNMVAHHLARHALSFDRNTSEIGFFPDHVLNLQGLEAAS